MKFSQHIVCIGIILSSFIIANFFSSCVKHDEISFTGTLVDVRACGSMIENNNAAAYFVMLDKPDSTGGIHTTYSGKTYQNVIMLFEPDRRIYIGDHISGCFYFDKDYGRANCGSWSDVDLPTGVFTDLTVD